MNIKFKNWEKFNPRKDIKHPRYVLLSNQIFNDPKIFSLNQEEFVAFIFMLCEASKANDNGRAFINIELYKAFTVGHTVGGPLPHRAHDRAPHRVFDRAVKKLVALKVLDSVRVRGMYTSVRDPDADRIEGIEGIELTNTSDRDPYGFPPPAGGLSPPDESNPVALWADAYKKKYGVRYAFQKKDFGMLKNAGKTHGAEACAVLFSCYLAIDEPLYSNAKHPLSLFFRDLQKISVAAQTSVNPADLAESILDKALGKQKLLSGEK